MLAKNNELQEFLETFNRKFSNFCQKAPVLLSFKTSGTGCIVRDETTGKTLTYAFDYSASVKENIHDIKEWLLKECYPVMIEEIDKRTEYTTDELQDFIEEDPNVDIDSLIMEGKREKIKRFWRIEKTILVMDNLFVRNMQTGELAMYKLDMPVSIFLSNMRNKWKPNYAYRVFKDKSKIVKIEEKEQILVIL